MINKIVTSFLGIILTVLIIMPNVCLADKPLRPFSYKIDLEDGNILVMLAENGKTISNSNGEEYPKSGLYENNSINPIYTIDWYAFKDDIVISENGKYLANVAPCMIGLEKSEAVSFYNDGELIKNYKISDLINDIDNLERTVSHYIWRDCSIKDWTEHSEEAFMINTIEETLPRGFYIETGKRKYFAIDDRATGEKIFDMPGMADAYQRMLKEDKKNRLLKSSALVGTILIVTIVGIFFIRKRLKK